MSSCDDICPCLTVRELFENAYRLTQPPWTCVAVTHSSRIDLKRVKYQHVLDSAHRGCDADESRDRAGGTLPHLPALHDNEWELWGLGVREGAELPAAGGCDPAGVSPVAVAGAEAHSERDSDGSASDHSVQR